MSISMLKINTGCIPMQSAY